MPVKHGKRHTPEYAAWAHMVARCCQPSSESYVDYGGRGIKVCSRWRFSFETFLADMGERPSGQHSLDRLDNDEDYTPDNCAWRTPSEQQNNKRDNRRLTHKGRTLTLTQWRHELGFPRGVIDARLDVLGWSVDDALSVPLRGRRRSEAAYAKLTALQVLAIRADSRPQTVIAAEYGIDPSAVSRIKSRKIWRHI